MNAARTDCWMRGPWPRRPAAGADLRRRFGLCAAPAPGLLLTGQAGDQPPCCLRRHEANTYRRSRVAGFAAARPAHVVTLAIGDVPGDDPAGRFRPDGAGYHHLRRTRSSPATASTLQLRWQRDLHSSRRNRRTERTAEHGIRSIATPMMALTRMADTARDLGLAPLVLGDALAIGTAPSWPASLAASVPTGNRRDRPPCAIGCETTVTIGCGPVGHMAVETPSFCSALRWHLAARRTPRSPAHIRRTGRHGHRRLT